MMNAENFYKGNLTRQRKVLGQRIHEAWVAGDPVVTLPFDTYPDVEKEMAELGWIYKPYIDKETGKMCASFYPNQFVYPTEE